MRVLLVDDETQCAAAVARELQTDYRHEVTVVASPDEAIAALKRSSYDVIVNDILYKQTEERAESHGRASGRQSYPEPIRSGLWSIRYARENCPKVGIVVWTVGDSERRLHLRYAYEQYEVRVFCSKASESGNDKLQAAIVSAQAMARYIDGSIQWYVAVDRHQRLIDTVLEKRTRKVLRAIAAGALDYDDIAKIIGGSKSSLRNLAVKIADECLPPRQLERGEKRNVKAELIAFASEYRQFFADEAVLRDFPNE